MGCRGGTPTVGALPPHPNLKIIEDRYSVYRSPLGLLLLPFDRSGWFGGYIIHHAVHPWHFVNNPIREGFE